MRRRSKVELVPPTRTQLRRGAIAGIPGAVSSVPDGMASGVLAGVSPIHGLYASCIGPIVGGLSASTQRMVIATTGAAALAARSVVADIEPDQRARALFLLTVLAGMAMVAAGLARLGRYTRFVSHSVMLGFLTGVAVNIVLGQLADLTRTAPSGSIALVKAVDVFAHLGDVHVPTLLVGLGAMAVMVVCDRSRARTFSAVLALALPTVVAAVVGADGIVRVSDGGDIPTGIPLPAMPHLADLSLPLVSGAVAIAVIVLVQGAGVAESAANLDGSRSDANGDFVAQGAANVASGLFQGMPIGGSVGQTALNIAAGARDRWASVFSGLWMLVILVALSGLVGRVPVTTLAAVLIVAAVGAVRVGEAQSVWRTSSTAQVAMTATFVATLCLPVAAAVGIGVALSLVLQLNREALDLAVVELVFDDDGSVRERPAPTHLRDDDVTVLSIYGSLFYAGARTLQARLPDPAGSHRPAVVLRVRGRTTVGATFLVVIENYAAQLARVGGTLSLSGVDARVVEQMRSSGRFEVGGPVAMYPSTEVLFASTERAYRAAALWTVGHVTDEHGADEDGADEDGAERDRAERGDDAD